MKHKRPSIKDIASNLGVSVTTVSFVLNGKAEEKRISDTLIKKVQDYIKEINYTPNPLAQSLRTGKSKIIVFMVEDISNSFFAKIARIIEDIAYEKGYKVLFCSNENKDEKSVDLINSFKERQVDGFIIVPSSGIKGKIQQLIEEKVPVVLFDRYFSDVETCCVVVDNEKSSYEATTHLIDNHYKNIGFVTLGVEQTQMKERLTGYKNAIKESGLHENVLIVDTKKDKLSKKREMKDFILQNPELDSVFFATNYLTEIGLDLLKWDFPEKEKKYGIITFDDSEYFKFYSPTISAVSQPLKKMGEQIMACMLNLLENEENQQDTEKIILQTTLQIRESSLRKKSGI